MARNTLKFDTAGMLDPLIQKLAKLGGDVPKAVNDVLLQAAETIRDDTIDALQHQHLPARGKYSTDDTRKSVIENPRVEWSGDTAAVPVGFDFSKPGAGGFLISGTPKMAPDRELNRMYKQKKYMAQLQNDLADTLFDYIDDMMDK